jgi:hypothetical protein
MIKKIIASIATAGLAIALLLTSQPAMAGINVSEFGKVDISLQAPVELVNQRTISSKTFDIGNGYYSTDAYIGAIHYKDDIDNPQEQWKDIDTTIVSSPKPNWDWEVVKGNWKLLIKEDTSVALGKDGHWIGFRYDGVAYLDWATKNHEVLSTRSAVTPTVTANSIIWNNIFGQVDLEYIYQNGTFKVNLYVPQVTRDWLAAHPPSSYGLSNQTTYIGGWLFCDWQNAYPAKDAKFGVNINWNIANEFIGYGINWWHPVKNKIVTALPIGSAYSQSDTSEFPEEVNIRYRFYRQGGNQYLLFGARVLDLNQLPAGTVVIDPTIDEQVDASAGDCFVLWYNAWYYSHTYSYGFVGRAELSELGMKGGVGMHWGLSISSGATISTAYFEVYASHTRSSVVINTEISGHDNASPSAFSTLADYQSRRGLDVGGANDDNRTTAIVNWDSIPTWTGGNWYQSPEIKTVIQEIADLGAVSAIVLFWDDHAVRGDDENGHNRMIEVYDDVAARAPKIHIEYTTASPDITNTPSSKAFGTVETSTDYWSDGAAPTFPLDDTECYFTVTNNSGAAADIDIKATNFTGGSGWTLTSGSPGADTVRLRAGKSGDANEAAMVILTTIDQAFISSLADTASKKWELKMETPTSFSDGDTKTSTVTLTASLS